MLSKGLYFLWEVAHKVNIDVSFPGYNPLPLQISVLHEAGKFSSMDKGRLLILPLKQASFEIYEANIWQCVRALALFAKHRPPTAGLTVPPIQPREGKRYIRYCNVHPDSYAWESNRRSSLLSKMYLFQSNVHICITTADEISAVVIHFRWEGKLKTDVNTQIRK